MPGKVAAGCSLNPTALSAGSLLSHSDEMWWWSAWRSLTGAWETTTHSGLAAVWLLPPTRLHFGWSLFLTVVHKFPFHFREGWCDIQGITHLIYGLDEGWMLLCRRFALSLHQHCDLHFLEVFDSWLVSVKSTTQTVMFSPLSPSLRSFLSASFTCRCSGDKLSGCERSTELSDGKSPPTKNIQAWLDGFRLEKHAA